MNEMSNFSVRPGLAAATPKVAVVSGYMPYFEEIMPSDFRDQMRARGQATADRLADSGNVLFTGLVKDEASGQEAARMIRAFDPDVVVLAPTMAAPAGYQYAAVRDIGRTPIVILNIHALETIPGDYTAHSIVPNSVTVGCMMINSLLRREGRWSPVISGYAGDPSVWERARNAIREACVAGGLAKARFGVMGSPLDGYLHVIPDAGKLADKVGCELVSISAEEFTEGWHSISTADVEQLAAAYASAVTVAVDDADISEYNASVRLALNLEMMVKRHRLSGGTYNCRNEYGVLNPEIGVLGCLANAHVTTHGYPFTCTGDIVSAIAIDVFHGGVSGVFCRAFTATGASTIAGTAVAGRPRLLAVEWPRLAFSHV